MDASLISGKRGQKLKVRGVGIDAILNTDLIQKAIDSCSKSGGGEVILPEGIIRIGTLLLKSGVILNIPKQTSLTGDTVLSLFPAQSSKLIWYKGRENHHNRALIIAIGQTNIGITGQGIIDGQGSVVYKAWNEKRIEARWMNIWMQDCRNVQIENIRLLNSPSWMQLYQACQYLTIRNLKVSNFGSKNNDGLDLDGCKNVQILNCQIDSDDDALVLKSLSNIAMDSVQIRDCVLSSNCNALKVGTETEGGIRNITVKNIRIIAPQFKSTFYKRQVAISGIALTMVDGGELENVTIDNVTIEGVKIPFFIRQGTRNRRSEASLTNPANSRIRNVRFSNVSAEWTYDLACHVTAVDSGNIEDVVFENMTLNYSPVDSNSIGSRRGDIPYLPEAYPEATLFGKGLPEVILFASGVNGLKIHNVGLKEKRTRKSNLPAFYTLNCSRIEQE